MYTIIFMGTPDFGVPALQALIADPRFSVVHVFSQPDRPQGRKQEMTPTPIKQVALTNAIPVSQPERLRNEENIDLIRTLAPDFIVVVAYGRIIPKSILDIPKFGCVNIHGSLLPKYRGASPIQASLLHGEKVTGISLMLLSVGMDEGPILRMIEVPVTPEATSETLFQELSILGANALPDTLAEFASGKITPIEQDHSFATLCGKITKEMGEIHFDKEDAQSIYQKWQAFTPWPGIYTLIEGKRIKFHKIVLCEDHFPIGTFSVTNKRLFIGTTSGSLEILELQEEGKKHITAKEYIAGMRL